MLAVRIMLEQGIEVYALYFYFVFAHGAESENVSGIKKFTEPLGVLLKVINGTQELLGMVKNPEHPIGKNMNPCIDCRIFTFKKAKEHMKEIGADFIITGEVLGERPLSQRKDALRIIDKKSELEGLVLRPLSAKLLEPTIPEKMKIVNRDKLFDISGRRRIQQISLAKKLGIDDYQNPAGGCLLTDKGFSNRLRDILKYNPNSDINNLELLKIGRHFRISDSLKFIVGRDEKENQRLLSFSKQGDYVFDILDIPSAIGFARRRGGFETLPCAQKDIELMASILARYSDGDGKLLTVSYKILPSQEWCNIPASPASEERLTTLRI